MDPRHLQRSAAAGGSSSHDTWRPIIILGAARSGTKLLRDLLAVSSGTAPITYDVNYLWRYRHQRYPHDALPAAFATERVRAVVCRGLLSMADAAGTDRVRMVEKTVSNTLRVPFVHAVFPDAMFVVITRDGRDVVESAVRCWQAVPRPALRKLVSFPWTSAMPHAVSYAGNAARRLVGRRSHVSSWGPRYPGIDDDVRTRPLVEVCALQWMACMDHMAAALPAIPAQQCVTVRYESLVRSPAAELTRLAERIGLRDAQQVTERAREIVSDNTVGAHRRLGRDALRSIEDLLGDTLAAWGYADMGTAGGVRP